MKKITVLLLTLCLTVPVLCGCFDPGGAGTAVSSDMATITETEKETESESETETETETEPAAEYSAQQLYELCRAAYDKTVSGGDISFKTVIDQQMDIEYIGLTRQLTTISMATEAKIKGLSKEDAISELHQTTSTNTNGERSTVKTDMFIDKDKLYYRSNDDSDYTVADKNSESASAFSQLIEKALTDDVNMFAEQFADATVTDNADGSKTVSMTPSPDVMKTSVDKKLEDFKSYFEAFGATDINIDVRSVALSNTVSKDGELVRTQTDTDFEMTMKIEEYDVKAYVKAGTAIDYTDIGQPVTIEFPDVPDVYTLYDPTMTDPVKKYELRLKENGTYEIYHVTENSEFGFSVRNVGSEQGNFTYNEDKTRITGEGKYFMLKTQFDSEAGRNMLRSVIESAAKTDPDNGALYDIVLKSMTDEGFKGTAEELKELKGLGAIGTNIGNLDGGEIILDRDNMRAYLTIPGLDLKENQYYIASEELYLTLNDDGTFIINGEYSDTEEGLGDYTLYYTEKGTYEKNDLAVECTMSSYNRKLVFDDNASVKAYKETYTEKYETGYLARVEYEYYIDLIMEDGYTEETDNTFHVTLEPHTQTAAIIDYNETEQ